MNILVAYFTHSRNTKAVAEVIARQTGGTLFEIEPVQPYPPAYGAVVEQAKREIRANHRPALAADTDITPHDAVFIGTPNWWSTVAPPVATFLSGHDFAGIPVHPFLTHGGGGEARIRVDIAKLCPGASVSEALCVYGGENRALDAAVAAWLEKIGVKGGAQ